MLWVGSNECTLPGFAKAENYKGGGHGFQTLVPLSPVTSRRPGVRVAVNVAMTAFPWCGLVTLPESESAPGWAVPEFGFCSNLVEMEMLMDC